MTGARVGLPAHLSSFVGRVRAATDKPLAVGFGISSVDQVGEVAGMADGVVVGSAFMKAVDEVWLSLCLVFVVVFPVVFVFVFDSVLVPCACACDFVCVLFSYI